MNEKTIALLFNVVFLVFSTFTSGCKTTGTITVSDSLEHQRRIAELETRISDYESRLRQYDSLISGTQSRLEIIRARADSIADRIDRLIFLFEQYEREVQRLIDENSALRGAFGPGEKNKFLAWTVLSGNMGLEDFKNDTGLRMACN